MSEWEKVYEQLRKLDYTQQSTILWGLLGILEVRENKESLEFIQKELELRLNK